MGTQRLRLLYAWNGPFSTHPERRQASEQALAEALGKMVIEGVSARKVAQFTQKMLGMEMSASTVSNLVRAIEPKAEAFGIAR